MQSMLHKPAHAHAHALPKVVHAHLLCLSPVPGTQPSTEPTRLCTVKWEQGDLPLRLFQLTKKLLLLLSTVLALLQCGEPSVKKPFLS
jgi:hypothetical protein